MGKLDTVGRIVSQMYAHWLVFMKRQSIERTKSVNSCEKMRVKVRINL